MLVSAGGIFGAICWLIVLRAFWLSADTQEKRIYLPVPAECPDSVRDRWRVRVPAPRGSPGRIYPTEENRPEFR